MNGFGLRETGTVKDQLHKMKERETEKGLKQPLRRVVDKLKQACKAMKEKLFEVKAEIKAKFSKTELIKKPFQAKRKLLSGILNCAEAAIEKTEQLAADVKQYQRDKAER